MDRYIARSAFDKMDDWPIWFVADARMGGLNVTAELIRKHFNPNHVGGVLAERDRAIEVARTANEATKQ